MIRDEIKKLFSNSDIDSAYAIDEVGSKFPAYVVRRINSYGVAIPYDGDEINESFANADITTGIITIDNNSIGCLFLTSSIESTRNEFAVFCEDFVDPGIDGEKRKAIVDNPFEWWKEWRLLIGNAISERKPFAILGEMLMYEYLIKNGKTVQWGGPRGTSHDLVCKDEEYEVKSTTSRYDRVIHVAGEFQLQKEKKLFLFFVRFEKNVNGISINDVVERLVLNYGESRDSINGKLGMQGYGVGSNSRNEKYQIHEVLQYEVDDAFPKIVPESFAEGKIPLGIEHIEYNVNLGVLDAVRIEL